MTYQVAKGKHPPSLELRPEIIAPKTKLPPPSLYLRDQFRVSIQQRAHRQIDLRTAVSLGGFLYFGRARSSSAPLVLGIDGGRLETVHDAHHVRMKVKDRRSEVFDYVRQHEAYNCLGDVETLNLQGRSVPVGVRRM